MTARRALGSLLAMLGRAVEKCHPDLSATGRRHRGRADPPQLPAAAQRCAGLHIADPPKRRSTTTANAPCGRGWSVPAQYRPPSVTHAGSGAGSPATAEKDQLVRLMALSRACHQPRHQWPPPRPSHYRLGRNSVSIHTLPGTYMLRELQDVTVPDAISWQPQNRRLAAACPALARPQLV